jgi:hypothetical protein
VHIYPLVPAPEGAEGARGVTAAVAGGLPVVTGGAAATGSRRRRGLWR